MTNEVTKESGRLREVFLQDDGGGTFAPTKKSTGGSLSEKRRRVSGWEKVRMRRSAGERALCRPPRRRSPSLYVPARW